MSGRHAAPARPARSAWSFLPLAGPGRVTGTGRSSWRSADGARWAITASVLVIVAVAGFSFAGPLFYHSDLTRVNLLAGNQPPGPGHPLGTDSYGLDILGRLMAGGRLSLEVGVGAGVLAAVIGTAWGAVAGYLGGGADAVMMRVVDAGLAVPALVALLLLASFYSPGPVALVPVIAVTSWLSTARLVRGAAITLRIREYVQAVGMMGGGSARVIARHIVPNAADVIIVNVSFQIADAIGLLAALSYLGLGIRPPASDWGDMIASGMDNIYNGCWWEIYPAGVVLVAVVVAFHVLGDGLRDRLGPPGPPR